MGTIHAYAAQSPEADLAPFDIERRSLRATDVQIEIEYCGVCHSDIHQVRNDWNNSKYPVVPGHEIVGRVTETGPNVSRFREGDRVAVGCMVDSCGQCSACRDDLEQYCEEGAVLTYNGPDRHLGGHTFGGYSEQIIVDRHFVLELPENLDPAASAPLLCAGITSWSPLRQWKVGKGDKVGVIGLGGLGHIGVKLADALGAEVVMISRSPSKRDDARRLGAGQVLISTDPQQMKAHRGSFDFLLNTIPVGHDLNPYLGLLKRDATMVLVGAIEPLDAVHGGRLIGGRKRIAGSAIGGIRETRELLEFCGTHGITCDVEVIDIQQINEAYERVQNADVQYRFVIDMKSLKH